MEWDSWYWQGVRNEKYLINIGYAYELLCISPCLHFVDFRVPVPASSLTSVAEGLGLNRSR
jgi:hypothetical protein